MVDLLIQYERGVERYFQRKNPVNLHSKLVVPYRQFIIDKLKKYPSLPKAAVDPWGITKEGSTTNHPIASIFEPKGVLVSKFAPYSNAIRNYMFSLTNFIDQSEHALSITENVRVVSEEQRRKFFEAAATYGIQERLVGLSVMNLIDAWSKLPDFQREFRKLLHLFVNQTALSRLERQEQQVYERLWSLWYFFAFEPYYLKKDARIHFSAVFRNRFEAYITELRNKITNEISGDIVLKPQNIQLAWGQDTTYTFLIDSSDGWNLYQQLNTKLRAILSDVFQDVQLWSASYYAVELKMQQLLIVPLVNGKLLNKAGYHLPTATLLSSREPHDLNFSLQPLPDEVLDQLEQHGVLLHNSEEVSLVRQLLEETANTRAIVAHLYDLVSIPDIEDEDAAFLQTYVGRTSDKLNEIINHLIQCFSKSVEMVAEHTFHYSHNQELAVEALQILRANLLSDEINSEGRIQLEKLDEWRNQLVNALGAAFALCTAIASEMR
jgi:hypothetical protein